MIISVGIQNPDARAKSIGHDIKGIPHVGKRPTVSEHLWVSGKLKFKDILQLQPLSLRPVSDSPRNTHEAQEQERSEGQPAGRATLCR